MSIPYFKSDPLHAEPELRETLAAPAEDFANGAIVLLQIPEALAKVWRDTEQRLQSRPDLPRNHPERALGNISVISNGHQNKICITTMLPDPITNVPTQVTLQGNMLDNSKSRNYAIREHKPRKTLQCAYQGKFAYRMDATLPEEYRRKQNSKARNILRPAAEFSMETKEENVIVTQQRRNQAKPKEVANRKFRTDKETATASVIQMLQSKDLCTFGEIKNSSEFRDQPDTFVKEILTDVRVLDGKRYKLKPEYK